MADLPRKVRVKPTLPRARMMYVALDYALGRDHSPARSVLFASYWALASRNGTRALENPYWTWDRLHAQVSIIRLEQLPGEVNPRETVTGGMADGPPVPAVLWHLMHEEGINNPYRPRWGGFQYEKGRYKVCTPANCKHIFNTHWPLMLEDVCESLGLARDTPDLILLDYLQETSDKPWRTGETREVLLDRLVGVGAYLASDDLLPPERTAKITKPKLNRRR